MNTLLLLSGIIATLLFSPLAAGASNWKAAGPIPAGSITGLTCESQTPQICLAINAQTLYRSGDAGRSWAQVSNLTAFQIILDPFGRRIYILTAQGLWASSDHGQSFHFFGPVAGPGDNAAFVPSPFHPSWMYILNGSRLLVSKNEGHTWKALRVPRQYTGFGDITESPFDSKQLYLSALIPGGGQGETTPVLLASDNQGLSWKEVWQGGPYGCEYRFFHLPVHPDRVLAYNGCDGPINILTASGFKTFSQMNSVRQIVGAPKSGLFLLKIAGLHSVWRSADGARNWNPLGGELRLLHNSISHLAVAQDSTLLVGTIGGGVFRCDMNLHCKDSNSGFQSFTDLAPIVLAGANPQRILTITTGYSNSDDFYGRFLYSSTDNGSTWSSLSVQNGMDDSISSLKVHPSDPNTVLAVPQILYGNQPPNEFFISHDGGKTWIHRTLSFSIGDVFFDPSNTHTFYTETLRKSIDDGATFVQLPFRGQGWPGGGTGTIVVDKDNPLVIYVIGTQDSGRGIILKSSDGGMTYTSIKVNAASYLAAWLPLPQRDSYLAVDTDGQVFRTIDGALTWQRLSQLGWNYGGGIPSIYKGDASGQIVLGVTTGGHLFESMDGASHWVDITPSFLIGADGYGSVFSITDPLRVPWFMSAAGQVFMFEPQGRRIERSSGLR